MNISSIAGAVGASTLLDFFIREFPHIGRRIQQAKKAGHDIQSILNELQGLDKKELQRREKKASLIDSGSNPLIDTSDYTRQSSAESQNVLTPENVGKAGLGLMAATALPYAATAASNLFPSNTQPPSTPPPAPIQPGPGIDQQMQQQAQAPIAAATQPTGPGQIAQAAQAIPSQQQQPPSIFDQLTAGIDVATLDPEKQQQLKFLGLISDQLQSQGKDLSDPAFKRLGDKIKKVIKGQPGTLLRETARLEPGKEKTTATIEQVKDLTEKWKRSKERNPNFPHSLSEVLQTNLGLDEETANSMSKAFQPVEEVTPVESKATLQEALPGEKTIDEPVQKEPMVSTPKGMGTVISSNEKKSLVEIDGKKHQVDTNKIIESPLQEKDLADLFDDVIRGIEKETGTQVSRNVDWSGYDPNTNELAYKPHGSDKLYVYEDIPPEDVEILTGLLTQRKTTGSNFIGAWEAGTTSPIGAAMYQLIRKLQAERGGKGNEYRNRYETIYDALEPAKLAAKRKHAEEKKKAKKPRTR